MSNRDEDTAVVQAVAGFFTAVEKGDWNTVRAALTDRVAVAHADDLQTLSGEQLASQWQQSHAGFATARYRLQPVQIDVSDDRAVARFTAQVTLVLPGTTEATALTIDGRYTVELEPVGGTWKIRSIRHDQPHNHHHTN